MAGNSKIDLNKNLKEYLSRNGNSGKSSLLKSVNIDSWFSKANNGSAKEESPNENSWFIEAQKDSFLPTLVYGKPVHQASLIGYIFPRVYAPFIPHFGITQLPNMVNTEKFFALTILAIIVLSLQRTKKQRIVGFVGFICMGIFCFTLAAFYAPLLLLKARKFCLLYSMGSLFLIGSFSLLWGPCNHIKHLFSKERLPFTAVYFGTMFLTLYSAMWAKNTLLTAICAICQVIALIWYIVSYIPGGQTGLYVFSKICSSVVTKTASKALPV